MQAQPGPASGRSRHAHTPAFDLPAGQARALHGERQAARRQASSAGQDPGRQASSGQAPQPARIAAGAVSSNRPAAGRRLFTSGKPSVPRNTAK